MEPVEESPTTKRRHGLTDLPAIALFGAILLLATFLRLHTQPVSGRTPDEQIYIADATRIAASGPKAVTRLVRQYNEDHEFWVYPPPTRVGFTFLVAAAMKMTGASAERCGVWLSFASSLLTILLTGLLGWRVFSRWIGLISMAFLSVSPLDLTLARRTWQDSLVAALGVTLLCFCIGATIGRRRRLWLSAFWILGAWFLLVKESALIIYSLLALWLLLDAWRKRRGWQSIIGIATISALVVLLAFAALVWVSGGANQFFQIYPHMAQSLHWNEYVFSYQFGPWYSFPLGLWVLSPVTTLLCACGVVFIFLRIDSLGIALELDNDALGVAVGLSLFVGACLVAATLPEGFKCLRYVSVVLPVMDLLAAVTLIYLLRRFQRFVNVGYLWTTIGIVAIALVCVADYNRFQSYVVRRKLDDLPIVRVVDQAFVADEKPSAAPALTAKGAPGAKKPTGSLQEATPEILLAFSRDLYMRGSYDESIAAAKRALEKRPDYAEAWNNIGAAYNALYRFEEGAQACQKAIELKPDFPLARPKPCLCAGTAGGREARGEGSTVNAPDVPCLRCVVRLARTGNLHFVVRFR